MTNEIEISQAPEVIPFSQLIREVGAWSAYNFGDKAGPLASVVGVTEEIGELYDVAVSLKRHPIGNFRKRIAKIEDSYADVLIYLANWCSYSGVCFDLHGYSSKHLSFEEPNLQVTLGRLAHFTLKFHQGIRDVSLDQLRLAGEQFFLSLCYDYEFVTNITFYGALRPLGEVVTTTWAQVKKRDWKNNPKNAHVVAEAHAV